jgi:ribosomal protein S18 acetylase RimI-like enzyme
VDVRIVGPGEEAALEEFLGRHWPQAMFLRGNMRNGGLNDQGAPYQGTYAAAFDNGQVVAVAAHYWNRNVVVLAAVALADVVTAAVREGRPVDGILGPWQQVTAARAVLGLEGRATLTPPTPEILYTLDIAHMRVPTALAVGKLQVRAAKGPDVGVVLPWRIAFGIEALGEADTPAVHDRCADDVMRWIAEQRLWLCEDAGTAVAMAAVNARLPEVVQIGGVWTPKELRGRGYARNAIAGLLRACRADGVGKAVLFTETRNLPAQKAYEALGFERVGDYGLLLFQPA